MLCAQGPHALATSGAVDLGGMLLDKFQTALAACTTPRLEGSLAALHGYGVRYQADSPHHRCIRIVITPRAAVDYRLAQ